MCAHYDYFCDANRTVQIENWFAKIVCLRSRQCQSVCVELWIFRLICKFFGLVALFGEFIFHRLIFFALFKDIHFICH